MKNSNTKTKISTDLLDKNGAKAVFEYYPQDSLAKEVVEDWIEDVAIMLVNVTSLIDPGIIVLGGGVMNSACKVLEKVREKVEAHAQSAPRIVVASLGDRSALYGGVELSWRYLDKTFWYAEEDH